MRSASSFPRLSVSRFQRWSIVCASAIAGGLLAGVWYERSQGMLDLYHAPTYVLGVGMPCGALVAIIAIDRFRRDRLAHSWLGCLAAFVAAPLGALVASVAWDAFGFWSVPAIVIFVPSVCDASYSLAAGTPRLQP